MSYIDDLTTARNNFASKLAEVSASPKPTYNIDGQSVSWTEYYRFLSEQVERLNKQINDGEPFEEVSMGIT
jgi:hypothetical protein